MTRDEVGEGAGKASPFGVYIHWPFCAQKCPYCDFNSHVRHGGWDEARFLSAYLREIDHVAGLIGTRFVSSIFFGGGTPSLMKPATVGAILDHVATRWRIAPEAEITLEANPGSVEAGRFAGYRAAGVSRVSMGFQSLDDEQLQRLGRIHSVAEAKAALEIARKTFDRFSFDLIYARPGQTPVAWRRELTEALAMAGDHLSLYQLTIEPDTAFEKLHKAGKLVVPDGDAALALYDITQELTETAGLPAYEVSNHARPGEESRHNLLYWRYGEYAGIGAGAHGRLIYGEGRHATVAERNPEAWAARVEAHGHGYSEVTALTPIEEADEMLLMGLRLSEGLDLAALEALSGRRPGAEAIDELADLGLLERCATKTPSQAAPAEPFGEDFCSIRMCAGPGLAPASGDRIRATPAGRLVLNRLVYRLAESMDEA